MNRSGAWLVGTLVAASALVGCAQSSSRRPSAVDGHAWLRNGPCSVLSQNYPPDRIEDPGHPAIFEVIDPATQGRFSTLEEEGCRTQAYRIAKRRGTVTEVKGMYECQIFGGQVLSDTPVNGLSPVYRVTHPDTRVSFLTLEPAPCERQGFRRDDVPAKFVNP